MVLLINPFTVDLEHEAAFLELWDQTNVIFSRSAGYISARLVKAIEDQAGKQAAPYTHINVAEWESRDHYDTALKNTDLLPFLPRYKAVSSFQPALYSIIRDDQHP